MPHRPAPGRGRPAAAPARRRARPRDRRRGRRAGAGRDAASRLGDRVGVAWLRHTCGALPLLPRGPGEPVPGSALHRLGRRRRLRRVRRGPRGATPTGCRTTFDDAQAAPLLCAGIIGYRALRRAALPPGRPARHLRLRRRRPTSPPRSPSPQGATVHVLTRSAAGPRAGAGARRGLGARRRRRAARAARRRHPVRARRRAGAGRAGRRSTAAARSPSPASTSATSRRSTTTATSSRSASCAASPPTPAQDGEEFLAAGRAHRHARRRSPATPLDDADRGARRPRRRPGQRRRRPRAVGSPARPGGPIRSDGGTAWRER